MRKDPTRVVVALDRSLGRRMRAGKHGAQMSRSSGAPGRVEIAIMVHAQSQSIAKDTEIKVKSMSSSRGQVAVVEWSKALEMAVREDPSTAGALKVSFEVRSRMAWCVWPINERLMNPFGADDHE